ncbi:hypothetical protein PMAYCL1PPCAC_23921, partial [Pristionchus mayeri]
RMLGGLRETLKSIQDEISEGVENLRKITMGDDGDNIDRLRYEAVEKMVSSSAGGHLLVKYQSELLQIREKTEMNIRLADLCSTRMGRAQQDCTEKANGFIHMENFLRDNSEINDSLYTIGQQLDKLSRFCIQTEAAMTHLEGLAVVLDSEGKVDEIRKRSGRISQIITAPSSSLATRPREISDGTKERQEEVMLEEFLSTQ